MRQTEISRLLKSLIPTTQDELSLLRHILYCAQLMQSGLIERNSDPAAELADNGALLVHDYRTPGMGLDLPGFVSSLTEEAKRYFHGLVEALEIHQSIHGQSLAIQSLTLSDKLVYEIKQIRDMCLEDGLRSIY